MATTYTQMEPRGWGHSAWGNPSTEDKEFRTKGWGDPKTVYTETEND